MPFFFFKWYTLFFRALLSYNKIEQKVQSSNISPFPTPNFPCGQQPAPEQHSHYIWWTHMTHHHPEPQFTLRFILSVLHPLSFNKRLMTCIYHCCTIQSSFTTLEILFAPPVHPSLPLSPVLVTNYVFTESIDLQAVLFLACWHWVGLWLIIRFFS